MNLHPKRINLLPATVLLLTGWLAAPAFAQPNLGVDAVCGEPFGVGRITVGVPRQMQPEPLGTEALCLNEKSGRALYPAIGKPPFGGLFADLVGAPQRTTIYFLFRGTAPLELTLQGRSAHTMMVTPRSDPGAHKQLLEAWWNQYTAPPALLQKKPDYPPLVDNYLTTTLARRLVLQLPKKKQIESWQDVLKEELGLMLGSESIRVAMQQDRILGLNNLGLPADQPLPAPITAPAVEFPPAAAEVEIEPIALRVPAECFYVRFGSFGNFLWMQDTLARWGGDLQNLVAVRGLDYHLSERMEQRLVLKQTALSRLLGPTVIADVAIVGTDMFFPEGAAYGILFYARQSELLAADMIRQRSERLKAGGVTEQKLEIDGHTVSLLASPDGSVRSYYAADGDYHFFTTSQALAKRFFETASGAAALGTSKEFRHARTMMPLRRKDTVFLYLSDAFFRNFTGPRYRVEMVRRLQAAADVDLVQLAVLASATEGKPGETIEQLIAGGLLPKEFGPRPDGSRAVLKDGRVYDSLRGHRGALLPVPDTPVGRVTRAEASAYRKFADLYQDKWGRSDPMMAGVKRHALSGNREKVVLDVHLSPFAAEHFDFLSTWAGPPDKMQLAPVKGDLVAGELALKNQRIFGGLADFGLPLELVGGRLLPTGRLRDALVGYIGTTGQMGLLGFLDVQIVKPPDARGYSSNRLGLYRRRFDQFTVFSLHPEVLAAVTPQLKFQEAERPAQLRIRIGDVSQARMTPFLNNFGYTRTRETSLGNLRLINSLDQQLHVPPEDCKEAAEFLMGAELICPLGGEYVFKKADGRGWWTSTALVGSGGPLLLGTQAPEGYQAPPLNWFRGLELDATMTDKALSAHAEIIMQLPEKNK